MFRTGIRLASVLCAAWIVASAGSAIRASIPPQVPRDYLSQEEGDKIRDNQAPGDRIKLYLSFAEDRLKKFQYEDARTGAEMNRGEILNGLLRGYTGCLSDADDEIDEAKDKQLNIHLELKLLESKSKEYLAELQKIEKAKGRNFDDYNDTLEDAMDGTKEAISDAQDALKEMLPAPVRRKQD